MSQTDYAALILAISQKLARPLMFSKEISDRRGTVVLKLVDSEADDYFALKFSKMSSYAADVIANEAKNLQSFQKFNNRFYWDSGIIDGFSYVLTKWLDGERLGSVSKSIRSIADGQQRKHAWLDLSLNLAQKVGDLHQLGYLHYDIQPEHFRFIDDKAYLFDFGLSYQADKTNPLYKGGLVHFQSPETCRSLLEEQQAIHYDMQSEVYAFAATLFFLYTEHTVMSYDSELSLEEKRKAIAKGTPRCFTDVGAEAYPEFENVLQAGLECDLEKRFSNLADFVTNLERVKSFLKL